MKDGPLGVIYEGKSEPDKGAVLNLLITGAYAKRFNSRVNGLEDDQKTLLEAFEKQWPGFSQSVKQMTFYRYHPRAIASSPFGRSRFDSLSDSLRVPQVVFILPVILPRGRIILNRMLFRVLSTINIYKSHLIGTYHDLSLCR